MSTSNSFKRSKQGIKLNKDRQNKTSMVQLLIQMMRKQEEGGPQIQDGYRANIF